MIRYLKHEEIDKQKWDYCISHSLESRIFGYSWYLDVVADAQWDALIEDDYQAVFPLPCRKKAMISYIFTPFFVQQLGIYSQDKVSEEKTRLFTQFIPSHFKLTELNLNTSNPAPPSDASFIVNNNYELDLQKAYPDLFDQYSSNHQRNLKKAQADQLIVKEEANADRIIHLFRSGKGKEVKHWKDNAYEKFKELIEICNKHIKTEIFGVYHPDGEFLGGAVFFNDQERAVFIFSSADKSMKSRGAMALLIDDYIRRNSKKKLILDFEGSNSPGLARFYAGFGSALKQYYSYRCDRLPKGIKIIRSLVN